MRATCYSTYIDNAKESSNMNATKYAYAVNVTGGVDVSKFHSVIMEAIANGGQFNEDFADVFKLTKTTEGSSAEYVLTFA